ncbi:MAG: hypothetical protein KF686_03225 [Ramlibacter sp.]|nr:hypothetical protein [Ramlibacter sp.]
MTKKIDVSLIYKLISQGTSLAVVSDFLKARNLPHSGGSWDSLFEKRIEPALRDGSLTVAELIELLRSVEEYGKQHVFLYRLRRDVAAELMDPKRIARVLALLEVSDLLDAPRVFEMPRTPTFADVRWQHNDSELVIKEVLTRESIEFSGETEHGDTIQRTYKRIRERVVNVGVIRKNGTFELRLFSRRGPSKYDDDLKQITQRWKPFLDIASFAPVSLSKAKEKLWTDRGLLAKQIRYSDVVVSNDDDISLRAFGKVFDADLAGNKAAQSSLDIFLTEDGYFDSSNIWFIQGEKVPARDIHVVLQGASNEVAIPTNCSQVDYEYVLSQLLALNT